MQRDCCGGKRRGRDGGRGWGGGRRATPQRGDGKGEILHEDRSDESSKLTLPRRSASKLNAERQQNAAKISIHYSPPVRRKFMWRRKLRSAITITTWFLAIEIQAGRERVSFQNPSSSERPRFRRESGFTPLKGADRGDCNFRSADRGDSIFFGRRNRRRRRNKCVSRS